MSILFEREALGAVYSGQVGSGSFKLFLPRISGDPNNDSMDLHPPVPENKNMSSLVDASWSDGANYLTSEEDKRPVSSSVSHVAFTVEEAHPSNAALHDFADRFGAELDPWFATLGEWLNLWTGQPLSAAKLDAPRSRGRIWASGNSEPTSSGWGLEMGPVRFDRTSVSRKMMTSACERANRGEHAPEEWQMYLRAKHWGSQRLQVIDAATSAEMAIERRLKRELSERSSMPESAIDQILKLPGIAEKLKLLEAVLPPQKSRVNRVIDRIAEPRNKAVHAGRQPDVSAAEQVLDTAEELLNA